MREMRDALWRNKYVARPFVSAFLFLVIPPYLFVTLNFRDATASTRTFRNVLYAPV